MDFKMNLKTTLLATGAIVGAMSPRPALAQWNAYDSMMSNNVYSRGWVNPYDNTYTNSYKYSYTPNYNSYTYFGSGSKAARAARQSTYRKKMPARERTEAEKFAKYNGTMYKPSAKVDAAGKIATTLAKTSTTDKAQIKKAMDELWKLYVKQAKDQNAPSTDLARTMAYCISANYYYYTGGTGVPETQVAELRKKLRTALSEDAKFRKMSAVQKQELNETMVILTHFAALGFEVIAKKAPAAKRQSVREGFKTLAGANLRGILGIDPSRVSFDKDGLVIKAA